MIEHYSVGIVVSAQGITDDQVRWLNKSLKWTLKALGGKSTVTVFVPGITTAKQDAYGLPRSLVNRSLPQGARMALLPGISGATRALATLHRHQQLANVDEVWCMPSYRQTNRLSKTRAALSFWMGVGGERGHCFKWVPPWVDSHEIVYQPKKKELPWISK